MLRTYDWANGNYDAINDHLISFDWHQLFCYFFDVEHIWINFKNRYSLVDHRIVYSAETGAS